MKIWKIAIRPEQMDKRPCNLITPRFFNRSRFPNGIQIAAANEERARQIATDEFPLLMPVHKPGEKFEHLNGDESQPFMSDKYVTCTYVEDNVNVIKEGIIYL